MKTNFNDRKKIIGLTPQETAEFATAAAVLKHSVEGDFNRVTVSDVENLAGGDGSDRVLR